MSPHSGQVQSRLLYTMSRELPNVHPVASGKQLHLLKITSSCAEGKSIPTTGKARIEEWCQSDRKAKALHTGCSTRRQQLLLMKTGVHIFVTSREIYLKRELVEFLVNVSVVVFG